MPERFRQIHNHPILGQYEQKVFDTPEEAGHVELGSQGKYGWQMPLDQATTYLLKTCNGKQVMDLGCGLGETITIPALITGSAHVFALDVRQEHVDEVSVLAQFARKRSIEDRLTRLLISETWWYQPQDNRQSTDGFFNLPEQNLDIKTRLDVIVARHSMQFGNPHAVMRVLDMASYALKPCGKLYGINFTPYTEYVFRYDNGKTMEQLASLNESYFQGTSNLPGGYLHKENGLLKITLKQLIQRIDIAKDGSTFIYLDEPTIRGLLRAWSKNRESRGLEADLRLVEGFYFTPDSITTFNKLVSGNQALHNKENYFFAIEKVV